MMPCDEHGFEYLVFDGELWHIRQAAEVLAGPSSAAQQAGQIIAEATAEARTAAAAAFAQQLEYGTPRPREDSPSSPTESHRQDKSQRVDDGMEQSLVVYEAPAAPMQPTNPMQHSTQNSAVTIGSIVAA